MQYFFSKQFKKDFEKLPKGIKRKAADTLEIFVEDPKNPALRNHELLGIWKGHYSIDVTGDIRAIYVYASPTVARFVAIGSHSDLYG